MCMDMSMDMKKERITELNHRQKVRFGTLLLPPPMCYILCKWNIKVASSLGVGRAVWYIHCSVNNLCLLAKIIERTRYET